MPQHFLHLRKRVEFQVQPHEAVPKTGCVEAQCVQGKVESIAGHLPEICMPSLYDAQPGVLKLLIAPESCQPVNVVAEHGATLPRRGRKVEERPVSVEYA